MRGRIFLLDGERTLRPVGQVLDYASYAAAYWPAGAIDRSLLSERVGRIPRSQIELLWKGVDVVFDR